MFSTGGQRGGEIKVLTPVDKQLPCVPELGSAALVEAGLIRLPMTLVGHFCVGHFVANVGDKDTETFRGS